MLPASGTYFVLTTALPPKSEAIAHLGSADAKVFALLALPRLFFTMLPWLLPLLFVTISVLPAWSIEEDAPENKSTVTSGAVVAATVTSMSLTAEEAPSLMHCVPCRVRSKRTARLNHSATMFSCSFESNHWKARRSLISSGKATLPASNFANVVSYIHSIASLPKRACDGTPLPPPSTFAVHQFSTAFSARLRKELNLPMCFESGETPCPSP